MILRENYNDVQAFLKYQLEVKQIEKLSAAAQWSRLRLLLTWADKRSLAQGAEIRPTFPAYLEKQVTVQGRLFSASHLSSVHKTCRAFLIWAKKRWPKRYARVNEIWIDSLRASRARGEQSELKERELYTVDDVRALTGWPAITTAQKRMRAAIAFMFLSGMRIGAFVTLPVRCVDLQGLRVSQLPSQGVRTKNHKAAKTSLLNIPDLLEICREWDEEVRGKVGEDGYWYAYLDPFGNLTQARPRGDRLMRRGEFRDDLVELCAKAGVDYKSPHKLRHGFAVHALKLCQNVTELKAVSQNLMHSTIGITDGIYGRLVEDDVHETITRLGEKKEEGMEEMVRRVVAAMKQTD